MQERLATDGSAGFSTYGSVRPNLLTVEIGVNNTIHADEVGVAESRVRFADLIGSFFSQGISGLAIIGAVPVRADFQPGPWFVADAYREIYRAVAVVYEHIRSRANAPAS